MDDDVMISVDPHKASNTAATYSAFGDYPSRSRRGLRCDRILTDRRGLAVATRLG